MKSHPPISSGYIHIYIFIKIKEKNYDRKLGVCIFFYLSF